MTSSSSSSSSSNSTSSSSSSTWEMTSSSSSSTYDMTTSSSSSFSTEIINSSSSESSSDSSSSSSSSNSSSSMAEWWLAGGVSPSDCVAAYQPIGASDLATSYINLANPGTYNSALGIAPAFDAATGWTFNGSTQYLTTGVTSYGRTWSLFVRFSDATADDGTNRRILFGASPSDGNRFGLQPWRVSGGIGTIGYLNGLYVFTAPHLATGVIGFSASTAYRNAVADGTIPDDTSITTPPLFIGAAAGDLGTPQNFCPAKIQAIAIYSVTLTPAQVSAISASMAAL